MDAGTPPHAHAFFLDADGTFTTLDLPGDFSTLGGINDSGLIDGSYVDSARGKLLGFLATPSAVTRERRAS